MTPDPHSYIGLLVVLACAFALWLVWMVIGVWKVVQ